MANKERLTVRSIAIEDPVEVKFLDNEAHDIVLVAEEEARRTISEKQNELDKLDSPHRSLTIPHKTEIDLTDDDGANNVELVQSIEEKGDQRITRRVETKTSVSEDPATKGKITKVTKTETTEVTKTYLIRTDEDARNAALELGVPDMSRIMVVKDGTVIMNGDQREPVLQRVSWKHPYIMRTSYRRSGGTPTSGYESEVMPSDLSSVPQGDFILIASDGTTIAQESEGSRRSLVCASPCFQPHRTQSLRPSVSEHNRLSSLCRCATGSRRRVQSKPKAEHDHISTSPFASSKERVIDKDQKSRSSIRKRIQESTRKFSLPKSEPLVSRKQKVVIEQENLQLSTFIFGLLSKIGVYQNEAEEDRGRKVISRGLDLLYYDRCRTWPEFANQLWKENEEYSTANHVVVPTANVIEFVMTTYPDLISLIDSVPDDHVLNDARMFAERPFISLQAAADLDEPIKRKEDEQEVFPTTEPVTSSKRYEKEESQQSVVPPARLLSIINDHNKLIPSSKIDVKESKFDGAMKGDMSDRQDKLPDVVVSPSKTQHVNIAEIIKDNERLPTITDHGKGYDTRTRHRRAPVCGSRCLSCFGDRNQTKPKGSKVVKPEAVKAGKEKSKDQIKAEITESERISKSESPSKPKVRSESQIMEIPTVQWPTIGVGTAAVYDTPDIILVDKPKHKYPAKTELEGKTDTGKILPVDKFTDRTKIGVIDMPPDVTIVKPQEDERLVPVKVRLDQTIETLESTAKGSLEPVSTKEPPEISYKAPGVTITEPQIRKYDVVAPPPEQACPHIRNILACHHCIPRIPQRKPKSKQTSIEDSVDLQVKTPAAEVKISQPAIKTKEPICNAERLAGIITCHRSICSKRSRAVREPEATKSQPSNICDLIKHHESLPVVSKGDYLTAPVGKPQKGTKDKHVEKVSFERKPSTGGVCSRCFSPKGSKGPGGRHLKQPKSGLTEGEPRKPKEIACLIKEAGGKEYKIQSPKFQKTVPGKKYTIGAPSIELPDIRLSHGKSKIFTSKSLEPMRIRLNQIFPGENAGALLDEVGERLNNGESPDQIRSQLIGRYPLAMIDLVILSMSFVERDLEANLIKEYQVPEYLVKVLDDNRIMYVTKEFPSDVTKPKPGTVSSGISIDTQTSLPTGGQSKFVRAPLAGSICSSICFPCASEKTITVPMSPDCIQLLEGLQHIPSGQIPHLASRISERMRIIWNLDRNNSIESSKVVKRILPKLRSGQVASLTMLRNDLKNESPKYFYVVDPCVDSVQMITERYDLNKCLSDAEIDSVLHDTGRKYAGIGLLSSSKCPSLDTSWVFKPSNLQSLVEKTEQRILSTSNDTSLPRKRRKLTKIINDAYTLMAKRHVANTTELRNQLYRLYPKDGQLVEYVISDIEDGLRSGRLQHECGRCSIRILINILHSKDVESCRIDGENDRLLSDRACENLNRNKYLLASGIRQIIHDPDCQRLTNVSTAVKHEQDLDAIIDQALNELKNVKSFDELKKTLAKKCKRESTAELLVTLIEQAYFANELEDPNGTDSLLLMKDRIHGKPLVLREICFALPDRSIIQCSDHRDNYALTQSPAGKLISVGQGLSWREANERARILFYRGRKPAVRYNDALDGFDVRMLLEQDGCVHEIPVSPDDVKRLLNSCGLYWDGLNISLLGKSDEILRRAEQEAFKILRETGFLHHTESQMWKPQQTTSDDGVEQKPSLERPKTIPDDSFTSEQDPIKVEGLKDQQDTRPSGADISENDHKNTDLVISE